MSDKLNSSLDDILKTTRSSNRRGRGARRPAPGRRSTEAPIGGVSKSTKQAKPAKAAPAAPAAPSGGETKLQISNLPLDVEENQLKDYFATVVNVGRPRRVLLQYGASGKSLGIATVIFNRADQAAKATTALQGVKIDNRLIRVDVLVSAANAVAQPQTNLADRVTQPKKDKPKPATASKAAPGGGRERGAGRGRERGATRGRGRGGRERTKKKTQEELDAEMEDYFPAQGGNDAMVTNGEAPQATGGDTMDEDQML